MSEEETVLLTKEEISGLAPRGLLNSVVQGIKREHDFSVAIMVDTDEVDHELSEGTRKRYVGAVDNACQMCQCVRKIGDHKIKCSDSDRYGFDLGKKGIEANERYRGEKYKCLSLGLWEFTVPIYEPESKTFIGVILGGQWRNELSKWYWMHSFRLNKKHPFKEFLKKEENSGLVPYQDELLKLYTEVPVWGEDLNQYRMDVCQNIAKDIANLFRFYIEQKKALAEEQRKKLLRELNVAKIQENLLEAQSIEKYWSCMPEIAGNLWNWLTVDWCLIYKQNIDNVGTLCAGFVEVGRAEKSRGLRNKNAICNVLEGAGPFKSVKDMNDVLPNYMEKVVAAKCLQKTRHGVVIKSEILVYSVVSQNKKTIAVLAMGSAPGHRNSNPRFESVKDNDRRIKEVASMMGIKYAELKALRQAERHSKDLEDSKKELIETVDHLQNALMSLNHQLHGPLWMLSGILANVRDSAKSKMSRALASQIEVGILVAEHGAFLTTGMASILASEQGRIPNQQGIGLLDVEAELSKLFNAMKVAFQSMDRIIDVTLDGNPQVIMDRLDFLFVFYTLLDNALKYADPGKAIRVGCSWEEGLDRYCFKVWSIGPPIAAQDVENVFKKFWRHHEAWEDDEHGLGIGCWAAQQCMERAGGDLYLEVNGPHSVFIVVAPEFNEKIEGE